MVLEWFWIVVLLYFCFLNLRSFWISAEIVKPRYIWIVSIQKPWGVQTSRDIVLQKKREKKGEQAVSHYMTSSDPTFVLMHHQQLANWFM